MSKPLFTVIVNTSDGFEDCWPPFFYLLKKYWPNLTTPIILNTESKTFNFSGLDLHCSCAQLASGIARKLTWSECLITCLRSVQSSIVLYLQEDYFIDQPVNYKLIDYFVDMMLSDPSIKHIGLTSFGSSGPFYPTYDERLWKIDQNSQYLISTQAGLWRTDSLLNHLLPWENGWMFEIFGTRRARKTGETMLTASRSLFSGPNSILSYVPTGIIKGKWHPDIPDLFRRNHISMDFNTRGFYEQKPFPYNKIETLSRLTSQPVKCIKSFFY